MVPHHPPFPHFCAMLPIDTSYVITLYLGRMSSLFDCIKICTYKCTTMIQLSNPVSFRLVPVFYSPVIGMARWCYAFIFCAPYIHNEKPVDRLNYGNNRFNTNHASHCEHTLPLRLMQKEKTNQILQTLAHRQT